ncbi:MAG: helix-turn-helix transcriptional regulator [Gammaproteobacteria bacterium]|nr:helix-turn-helix transcriptional regulator [Gammaproteobacteria bacterium]MBL6999073.1 helix-turn-helix transcriptional regulator [Gammaproteobacteria bacterium]
MHTLRIRDVQIELYTMKTDALFQPLKLGEKVREIRLRNRWTLEEAGKRAGLAKSTLSKIENEQISPSFDVVQKLAAGLGIDVPQLFVSSSDALISGRRSCTLKGQGKPHPTRTYDHELLATELTQKKMVPFKSTIHARSFDDFSDWIRHSGEEFLLVLSGVITFFSEFYEPVRLEQGDSIYYDAGMGHVCISESEQDAQILWVCTPSDDLMI